MPKGGHLASPLTFICFIYLDTNGKDAFVSLNRTLHYTEVFRTLDIEPIRAFSPFSSPVFEITGFNFPRF